MDKKEVTLGYVYTVDVIVASVCSADIRILSKVSTIRLQLRVRQLPFDEKTILMKGRTTCGD